MLTQDGCVVYQEIKPIGRGKTGKATWYAVHYDREYVLQRLKFDVVWALNIRSFRQLIELLAEVWKLARNISNNDALNDWMPEAKIVDLSNLKTFKLHGRTVYDANSVHNLLEQSGINFIANETNKV